MNETDCEIEYLDEDEEIVQQCVQAVEGTPELPVALKKGPLLVERKSGRPKRKRKLEEEDSDYEPEKDMFVRKKKIQKFIRSSYTPIKVERSESYRYTSPVQVKVERAYEQRKDNRNVKLEIAAKDSEFRKKLDICIPDYDDPICLPVRAIKRDSNDMRRLRNWNNLCLEHFKTDGVLRPDTGETVASKRTLLLSNVNNRLTGRLETAMWCKTTVENKNGYKKSEVTQCILPKYREKLVLNSYNLIETKQHKPFRHVEEVILTKEDDKEDGERLIVYKPKENLSLVYKMFEKNPDCSDGIEPDDDEKRYMKEVACCRVCAPCYQLSWRGLRNSDQKVQCEICRKQCGSAYNLLSHLKSHSALQLRRNRGLISRALADVLEYHYRCRICQQKYASIRDLRRHVLTHRGTKPFICEVGSHQAT